MSTGSGGGTETINSYAVLSGGMPAQDAIVRAIDPYAWKSGVPSAAVVIDSTIADGNGHFTLVLPAATRYVNIQIDGTQEGAFSSYASVGAMNGTTFQLQQYATLDATLGVPNQGMSKIFLSGSMYASPVDQSGHFAVNRVAPGNYTLVGLVASELVTCGSVSLVSGQSATVTGLNSSIDRVLIDDLSSGISTSALGMILPGLYWYSYSDSGSARWNPEAERWDWTAFPNPTSSGRSMARMRPESDPAGNTFLRCEVAFDNSAGDSWAGVGIHLKDVNGYGMDLSKMTSLSLRCRGEGSLIVSLETNALETATNSGSNYAYVIALTDSWVQHRIYPDSLKIWPAISDPGQFKWSEVSKRVEQIEFFYTSSGLPLYDTLNMMLDDLYLDGVRLSDVAP